MKMTKEERAERLLQVWLKCNGIRLFVREHVIEEQDRREGPLVEALRSLAQSEPERQYMTREDCVRIARKAIAAWETLDAKPEPTVAECQREAIAAWDDYDRSDEKLARLNRALAALKAAVEREEGKR